MTYDLRTLCEDIEAYLADPSITFLVKLEVWRHSNSPYTINVTIWDGETGSYFTGITSAEVFALFKTAHPPLATVRAVIA